MLTQSLFPSVCLHYVMERVVRGYMDPSNLISHCGRTAYIRSSGMEWGRESEGLRQTERAEDLDVGDGFRMKWSLENGERLITWTWAIEKEKWKV